MSAAQSVIGYVSDEIAKGLHAGQGLGKDQLELPLDPGKHAAHLRVHTNDIQEVRVGPSKGGQTSLQLILKAEASYEIVSRAPQGTELTSIQDPAFWYGLGRPRWFVIYVGPIFRPTKTGVLQLVAQ
jgi:hypothetical protein